MQSSSSSSSPPRRNSAIRSLIIPLSVVAGLAPAAACSASGDALFDPFTEVEAGATEPGQTVSLPPPGGDAGGPGDAGRDAAKKDAGKDAAAAVDAAPPPEPGEGCPVINAIIKRTCGICGIAEAVCLANADGGTTGVVSPYSPCTNEVADGCTPGTTEPAEPCGNCGTQTRTCSKYCAWQTGACQNQPVGGCAPTSHDYTAAGCTTGGTYRARQCKNDCTWDGFSSTCGALDFELIVSATPGGEVSGIYPLRASMVDKRINGTCPNAYVSSTTDHPYVYVELVNPSSKVVTVSAWNAQASSSGTIIDTLMASYAGNVRPTTDDAREACQKGIEDYCPTGLPCAGDSQFAGLTGANAIVIPAAGSALVWFGTYGTVSGGGTVEGDVKLVVRTDGAL